MSWIGEQEEQEEGQEECSSHGGDEVVEEEDGDDNEEDEEGEEEEVEEEGPRRNGHAFNGNGKGEEEQGEGDDDEEAAGRLEGWQSQGQRQSRVAFLRVSRRLDCGGASSFLCPDIIKRRDRFTAFSCVVTYIPHTSSHARPRITPGSAAGM